MTTKTLPDRVYVSVDPRVWATLGYDVEGKFGAGEVREAARRWAELVASAGREVEGRFSPEEWKRLATEPRLLEEIDPSHLDDWHNTIEKKLAHVSYDPIAMEVVRAAIRWYQSGHRKGRWWEVSARTGEDGE